MNIQILLVIAVVLLCMIFWELSKINSRLKERFPTEKEQEYKWSQDDPLGHWEAHTKEKEVARAAPVPNGDDAAEN